MNKKILMLIWDATNGYRFKLILFWLSCGFSFYFVPILVNPYIFSLFGNLYQEKLLTVRYAVILSFAYAIMYSMKELFRFLFIEKYLWYGCLLKVENVLRKKIFNYVMGHPVNYYNDKMSGVIAEKANKVAGNFPTAFFFFTNIVSSFICLIVSLVIYFKINYILTLAFCVWSVLFFILYYFSSKFTFKRRKMTSAEISVVNGIINDDIANIKNIKSFSNEKFEEEIIKKQDNVILEKVSNEIKVESLFQFLNSIVNVALTIAIFSLSYYLVFNKQIMIGTFVFIAQNIVVLKINMRSIQKDTKTFIELSAEIKDGLDTLLEDYSVVDKKDSKKLKFKSGKIVFKNVNFKY